MSRMRTFDDQGKVKAFDLEFVTADRKRTTGGELKRLINAKLMFTARDVGAAKGPQTKAIEATKRPPNHQQHDTINVLTPEGSITKVHVRLITSFNNQTIIW